MINTILFDLDGTLLPIKQEQFVNAYFGEVVKRFSPYGYTKEQLISSIWAGTKAMVANDGSKSNYDVFWDRFAQLLGVDVLKLIPEFNDFYETEFNQVKKLIPEGYSIRGMLDTLKGMGYTLVLATNPIFPLVASVTRLGWIGATTDDFIHITTMENSRFSKPNIAYYTDLLETIGKKPEQCLMVGNNAFEDMCASSIGCKVFLATDYLENDSGEDISELPQGNLAALMNYIALLKVEVSDFTNYVFYRL